MWDGILRDVSWELQTTRSQTVTNPCFTESMGKPQAWYSVSPLNWQIYCGIWLYMLKMHWIFPSWKQLICFFNFGLRVILEEVFQTIEHVLLVNEASVSQKIFRIFFSSEGRISSFRKMWDNDIQVTNSILAPNDTPALVTCGSYVQRVITVGFAVSG
jgi:hypothetical protein